MPNLNVVNIKAMKVETLGLVTKYKTKEEPL